MDLKEVNKNNPNRHPWEISRRSMIMRLIRRKNAAMNFADIGSGDCYVVSELRNITKGNIFAVDVHYNKPERVANVCKLLQVDGIPDNSVDCMLLMDVLEHVKDESYLLQKIKHKVKQDGIIIITVPACQYLFSSHDTYLKHYRRYEMLPLVKILEQNGFNVCESFSFYAFPYTARLLTLLREKMSGAATADGSALGKWRFGRNSIVTIVTVWLLNFDFAVSKLLKRLPGLSLCVVCRPRA